MWQMRVAHEGKWSLYKLTPITFLGSDSKEFTCEAGDLGSILGWGRSPGGGHGNPLQYFCLEKPMGRGAWRATVHGVAQSDTRLSDFHFTFLDQDLPPLPLPFFPSLPHWLLKGVLKNHLRVMMNLVVQVQLRIRLAIQGMQARFLVRELRSHMPRGNWTLMLQLEKAHTPRLRAHTLQWSPSAPNK